MSEESKKNQEALNKEAFESQEEFNTTFLDEANMPKKNMSRDRAFVSADYEELQTAAEHLGVTPSQVLAVKEHLGGEYKREVIYDFFENFEVVIEFRAKEKPADEGCSSCSG